jgi:hypothetical protein
MPILKYFGFVGAALVALLFVANATLEKGPSPVQTSSLYGLPKPWKPDPTQTLTATSAPEPDMSSDAVLAAAPKAEPARQPTVAVAVEAPKKKKHVAVTRRPVNDGRQIFAWQRNDNTFAGGGFFGRF